jgi:hypothetical protein
MKRLGLMLGIFVIALACVVPNAWAQGKAKQGPDPSVVRDPDLEKDSKHNLEVAWQYFKLRKAYRASLARSEEIIAGNPNFAQIDEALFIAGESSLFLSQKLGKQAPSPTSQPEKLREDARDYLSRIVKEHPDSSFRKQAEADLQSLGGVKKQ